MEQEPYGIDIENANKRAVELIPEDFFWSGIDELAPFGSDEGDMALYEYRDWRKINPKTATIECLKWVIEDVGEMNFADYNYNILNKELIQTQIDDDNFNDQQYIWTLDISIIATGFAQLVDEGLIELANIPIIQLAIHRQLIWAELSEDWEYSEEYISNLKVLDRVLKNI